ncbi:MAG: hypothetical protein H5T86_14070 [Armatimonadetes bacterium]|nr:hypothetical protein [Armatimonadota bacterium]
MRVEVSIDGRQLSPPPPAARSANRLLLAAEPICEALGVPTRRDLQAEALILDTPLGQAILRANSTRVTLGDRDMKISAPLVQFAGTLFVPVHLLARLCNASAAVSADGKSVAFTRGASAGQGSRE